MAEDRFITYTHPSERLQTSNRRRVARFIALHHRNRSAPSTRSLTTPRDRVQTRHLRPGSDSRIREQATSLATVSEIPRDGSGLREDPFSVLPTIDSANLIPAMDYCTYSVL